MMFMNEWEIVEESTNRHGRHPVLGPATRFLRDFMREVNAHSDGWPYWSAPVKSARQLMTLIYDADRQYRNGRDPAVTNADVRKALGPIKAFMTRRGHAAGMTLPLFGAQ